MDILKEIWNNWNDILETYGDPRLKNWFMMSSPIPSTVLCILYVLLVLNGRKIMSNRQAFELRKLMILYNFSMVLISAYLFKEFLLSGWLFDYSIGCQPVDTSNSPKAIRMVTACWLYYLSKFLEFFDTIFFILRKKFNQITLLHVLHHGLMAFSCWFGVRFAPGGMGSFYCVLNSFVHILMYSYYGLAAFGTKFEKYLWWKRYMTKIQITQFILVMIHLSQLFFIECDYPIFLAKWILYLAILFLVFFANYFIHEYYLRAKKQKTK